MIGETPINARETRALPGIGIGVRANAQFATARSPDYFAPRQASFAIAFAPARRKLKFQFR
jgi:hypothetical protein